jgi:raffinose/stachyose/melibiose transport system substrate-binding protein
MSISKRLIVLVLLLVLASVSMGVVSAQDEVVIEWWHIDTAELQAAYWEQVAADFMAANPGVTINITVIENQAFKGQLTNVMQAGDPPDLFRSWGGGYLWTFDRAGLLRDITPELDANDGEWRNSFSTQAALNLYGQDGEMYGAPYTWGAVGFFYNRALFEQAGLDPDVPPATWDELLAAVEALQSAGIVPFALGEGDQWPGHFWWVYLALRIGGGEAFLSAYNRDGAFTDEPFIQAGEYLASLVELNPFQEGFLGQTYADQQSAMTTQLTAMELMGQWAPGTYRDQSEDGTGLDAVLGWFPFPVVEGGVGNPGDVLGGGDGYAVGANAPDETVAFLQYLTSEEVQAGMIQFGNIPTVFGAEDLVAEDPIAAAILAARNDAPYFQLYYDQFLPAAIGAEVNAAVEGIFSGVLTPEEAAELIEETASFELD